LSPSNVVGVPMPGLAVDRLADGSKEHGVTIDWKAHAVLTESAEKSNNCWCGELCQLMFNGVHGASTVKGWGAAWILNTVVVARSRGGS